MTPSEPNRPVDRRPLKYRRIADDLRAGIRAGEYSPGRPLPGENDLMARYQVARMTVRQALAELQREGLAVARRGSGVYVSDFSPIVRDATGRLPENLQVDELEVTRTAAPGHVAAALRLDPDAPLLLRSARHTLGQRRVMLSATWRAADDGPAPTRFREEVRARPAGPEEADRLDLAAGAPVLALSRLAYAGELPVELTEMVLDASVYVLRYDFGAELTTPNPAGPG